MLKFVTLVASLFIALPGAAQDYPTKPVRFVVAQAAGSSADILARMIAQRLSQAWDRQVFVDNRPGANGIIGMQEIQRAAPDGYTMGLAAPSPMTVNQFIYKSLPYKPLQDFVPVTQLTHIAFVLVARPSLPVKTVKDLVALAKQKPDQLNYSSPGVGNLSHLGSALLASEAGIQVRHIPNKGDTAALTDVISENTDFIIITLPAAMPHIRSGKLRLLAVTGRTRSPVLPDAPTMAESGYPGVVIEGWGGLIAPVGTPAPIIAKMQQEIAKQFATAELREAVKKQGSETVASTPEAFAAFLRSETAKWGRVIETSGIQLNQ